MKRAKKVIDEEMLRELVEGAVEEFDRIVGLMDRAVDAMTDEEIADEAKEVLR